MFFRPIYFSLKRLLLKENLLDVTIGGLANLALQVLILAFLDMYEKNHKDTSKGSGKALAKFFKFYSNQFDPKKHQIQIFLNNSTPFKYTSMKNESEELQLVDYKYRNLAANFRKTNKLFGLFSKVSSIIDGIKINSAIEVLDKVDLKD